MGGKAYGAQHRQTRKDLLPAAINTHCPICGLLMLAGDLLELDHTVPAALSGGRSGGDRIVHRHCNRRRGANLASALAPFRVKAAAWRKR